MKKLVFLSSTLNDLIHSLINRFLCRSLRRCLFCGSLLALSFQMERKTCASQVSSYTARPLKLHPQPPANRSQVISSCSLSWKLVAVVWLVQHNTGTRQGDADAFHTRLAACSVCYRTDKDWALSVLVGKLLLFSTVFAWRNTMQFLCSSLKGLILSSHNKTVIFDLSP